MKWRVVEKLDNNTEVFQYITNAMAPHPTRDFVELRYATKIINLITRMCA